MIFSINVFANKVLYLKLNNKNLAHPYFNAGFACEQIALNYIPNEKLILSIQNTGNIELINITSSLPSEFLGAVDISYNNCANLAIGGVCEITYQTNGNPPIDEDFHVITIKPSNQEISVSFELKLCAQCG